MGGGASEVAVGVREGDILAGKYRIDKILGAGGMGVVVAARHMQLDEKVAIKFLLPEALGSSEAMARFAREARAAVKIKSEHVARVIDVGTLETGAPYIVMEYLEGGDLAAWVHQRGALAVEQAVEFILQACEAIADAHGLGIVHRDLKPSNLFCVRRSDGVLSVKVLDFGISKVTGLGASGPDMGMTKTKAVMGSPLYMSPEQMHSAKEVDARTDIWALGVILYELLTGSVPFSGDTLPEICFRIATEPPPPLRSRRPDAPDGIEAVILKCLEKDRTRRYSNVAELAVALAPFGPKRARGSVERIAGIIQSAGLSASALGLPPSSDPTSPAPATQASWGQTKSRTLWGSKGVPLGIAAAGIAVLCAVFWMWRSHDVARRAEPAAASGPSQAAAALAVSAAPLATVAAPNPPPAVVPALETAPSASALTTTAMLPLAGSGSAGQARITQPPPLRAARPAQSAGTTGNVRAKPGSAADPFAQPH